MIIRTVVISVLACICTLSLAQTKSAADAILGKWESSKKNVIVEVYKESNEYKARILWFDDTDDLSRPKETRRDIYNPDPALRNRKILGLTVLKDLTYNKKNGKWENGIIYDTRTGKEWNASASLVRKGLLKVRGYWHFEFIGRSMTFNRVK